MSDSVFREQNQDRHIVPPQMVAAFLVMLSTSMFCVGIWSMLEAADTRRSVARSAPPAVWPESSSPEALRRRIDDLERRISRAEGQLERIPMAPP
jgi:hypothetical protein